MNFADFADRAGPDVLNGLTRIVQRASLIPHLRGEFGFRGAFRKLARFVYAPAQRLLHVHVLVQIHRGQSDGRVHMVRRSHHHRINVLLLFEHFAVIRVALGLGNQVIFQMKNIGSTLVFSESTAGAGFPAGLASG